MKKLSINLCTSVVVSLVGISASYAQAAPEALDGNKITKCTALYFPGHYVVKNDITSTDRTCLDFKAPFITVDMDGHTIEYDASQAAVSSDAPPPLTIGASLDSKGGKLINTNPSVEAKFIGYDIGVSTSGDLNLVKGIEVEESSIACFEVTGNRNFHINNIAENCTNAGFVLGKDSSYDDASDNDHHKAVKGNVFAYNISMELKDINAAGFISYNLLDTDQFFDFNIISNFVAVGNKQDHGIYLDGSCGNIISDSAAANAEEGIEIELYDHECSENIVTNIILESKVSLNTDYGIGFENSHGGIAAENYAVENGTWDIFDSNAKCATSFHDLERYNAFIENITETGKTNLPVSTCPGAKDDVQLQAVLAQAKEVLAVAKENVAKQ